MPAVTLGAFHFGMKTNRDTSFAMLDYYFEKGGSWIDTARVYSTSLFAPSDVKPYFTDSEETLGAWIHSRKLRDRIRVITKGGHWDLQTKAKRVNAGAIQSDVETSLKKLNTDFVDIYFLHRDDESVPVSEIMPALHNLITSGKALVLGASNWKINRIREANAFAGANGLTPFSISQVRWSYAAFPEQMPGDIQFDMEKNPEELNGYIQDGTPLMAYSAQAGGIFVNAGDIPENFNSETNRRRVSAIKQLSARAGVSPAAAGFAYLWSRKIPVTAMAGCSTLEQLKHSLADCDWIPSAPDIAFLEQAF